MPDPRFPQRMRRNLAAQYLNEVHGIPFESKTLANRNAAGLDPKPEYLGTIPFYRDVVLDAYAETAFTPESPVAVTRRRIKQHLRSRHSAAASGVEQDSVRLTAKE
jgi:hypothetical protein